MDLAARKYRLIERLTSLVSAEKLDRIEGLLNNEIFKDEGPILTKEHKDILEQRLANHKLNQKVEIGSP